MQKLNENQSGVIHHLMLFALVAIVVGAISFTGYKVYKSKSDINAKADIAAFPSGASSLLGTPALLVDHYGREQTIIRDEAGAEDTGSSSYTIPAVITSGRYIFGDQGVQPFNSTYGFRVESSGSLGLMLRYQLDITTGNSVYIRSTVANDGSGLNPYSSLVVQQPGRTRTCEDDSSSDPSSERYCPPSTQKITEIISPEKMTTLITNSGVKANSVTFCVGNGYFALAVDYNNNSNAKGKLFVGSIVSGSVFQVSTNAFATKISELSCMSTKVYFTANSKTLYNVALNPAAKPLAKKVKASFAARIPYLRACGGQFSTATSLVYESVTSELEYIHKIAVVNTSNNTIKYIAHEFVKGLNSCTLSPDGKSVILSGYNNSASSNPEQPESSQTKEYSLATGQPTSQAFIEGLLLQGWAGTSFNY